MSITQFDFTKKHQTNLLITAGGFEKRALSFARRIRKSRFIVDATLVFQYKTQEKDNAPNYSLLLKRLVTELRYPEPRIVEVDVELPDILMANMESKLSQIQNEQRIDNAVVDISGMAQVLICCVLGVLQKFNIRAKIVYTEAESYHPKESEWEAIKGAVKEGEFAVIAKYLRTAGLRDIQIPTKFKGNFRPGKKTCLFVLPGYEPNRVQGLLDEYAPNAIVAFYGRPPKSNILGRQQLSIDLHQKAFEGWRLKTVRDVSTLDVENILEHFETVYSALREEYDVGIVSQCSKMQTVASYLFWRLNPELQLLFTSAVKISYRRYSRGEGVTFQYDIN